MLLAISLTMKCVNAGKMECKVGYYVKSIGHSVDGTRPFCDGDCNSCTQYNAVCKRVDGGCTTGSKRDCQWPVCRKCSSGCAECYLSVKGPWCTRCKIGYGLNSVGSCSYCSATNCIDCKASYSKCKKC